MSLLLGSLLSSELLSIDVLIYIDVLIRQEELFCARAVVPVSDEIFAPVRKSPLAKRGDYFMHAEHEKFAPRRFIHDRRL